MKKYSKAVSEMHSQFEQGEAHPLKKYVGRWANYYGEKLEVVGYSYDEDMVRSVLIVGTSATDGWPYLWWNDVIFKEYKSYWYVHISDLID